MEEGFLAPGAGARGRDRSAAEVCLTVFSHNFEKYFFLLINL